MSEKITLSTPILMVSALIVGVFILTGAGKAEAALGPGDTLVGGCQHEYLQTRTVTNFIDGGWDQQIWPSSYNTVWCQALD